MGRRRERTGDLVSRINELGQAVAGVADGVITIDGAVPAALLEAIGGGGGWLTADECGYQRKVGPGDDDYICEAYSQATGQTRTLADRGANTLRCDGEGRWATWRPGEGVRDEHDRRWEAAALLDYDKGTLVICPDQRAGRGIQLLRDGVVIQEIATGGLGTDATEGPNVRLVDGVLAYQADGVYHLVGSPTAYRPPPAPVYLVPVPLADGRVAVLERDATRLYLRWPDNPARGRMIDESGAQFSAQARQRDDGQIVVTWWRGAACLPQEFTRVLVDPSELLLDDLAAAPPVRVDRFSRPTWLIPFHATRHGQSVVCPGHAEVITDGQDANVRVSRRPVVADRRSEPTVDDLLALFVSVDDDLPAARTVADRRGVPLLAYWDFRSPFPLDRVNNSGVFRPSDWLGVMLYCNPDESIEDFREGARRQVAHAASSGHPVCLVVQMFDRNGAEKDRRKLSALQPIWRELAEAHPQVIAIAPFAVIRGEHGVTAYPELQAWLDAYGRAMTAPDRQNPEIPEEPEVIPTPVMQRIIQFAGVFPVPQAPDHEIENGQASEAWVHNALRMGWKLKLAQQLCHDFGPDWATKGTSPEWASKEAIAHRRDDGRLDVWDMLKGAATGRPTLDTNPTYHLVDAHWIPVDPVNHLGGISAPAGRATIDAPFPGITAFDLGCRLAEGNTEFLDQKIRRYHLVPRVVIASWFGAQYGRTYRSMAEGRSQLTLTLQALEASGDAGQFVLLCDTAKYGATRAQALDHVRDCIARMLRHPSAAKALQGSNERTHSVEADYMREDAFWDEVAALIPLQFPFTVGAGHGGEGVSITRHDSYLVHHGNRQFTPEQNADIVAAAVELAGRHGVLDEELGIAESDRVAGRQRTDNPEYYGRLAAAAKARGLSATFHCDAGMTCDMAEWGPAHEAGLQAFLDEFGVKVGEDDVTTEQIAQVFAGGFFEQVTVLLKLSGSVEARRPAVFAWLHEKIAAIDGMYQDIFKRHCDLEGHGSRLRLYLDHGWTDAQLREALQKAYDAGDR